MKLKKVETKGFKSFADRATLHFDGGVVGVVGPNGSGKSNINDAIKWVLGEQSIKSLRGDGIEDVIFSGSKLVKASNKAEVHLTFDNSEKKVSLPHQKIVISRVVERGKGNNKYFINGELARLKDVREIAMESGIGKSSLAIISQGTISDIAEASPENRRLIFEEAAGISKYKSRKKEALKKLDNTSASLEKVKTVISELEKQLAPLKRQAQKARLFLEKKSKLKNVEISLIVKDVLFFEEKISELQDQLEDFYNTKDNLETKITSLDSMIIQKNKYKLNLENEILELSKKFQETSEKIKEIQIRSSQLSQKRKMIIDGEVQATSEVKSQAMQEELKDLSEKIAKYNHIETESLKSIENKKTSISEVEVHIEEVGAHIETNKSKLFKLKTKLAILKDHKENKSNLFKGVKSIVENQSLFTGFNGLVSDLIKVEQVFRKAIEAVLSSALQHIVVNNSQDAVKAVNFLKTNRAGKATFIPLESLKPKHINPEHQSIAQNQPGFVGMASSLVDASKKHEILKDFLLGNILVAKTIEDATNISKLFNTRYMVISLDGDIVRPGGVISGGFHNKVYDKLGIEDQIKKIINKVPILEADLDKFNQKHHQLINKISEDRTIIGGLSIEIAKIREKKSVAKNQFANLKISFENATQTKFEEHKKVNIEEDSSHLESEKSSLEALLKAKRESSVIANNELAKFTISKNELEKNLRELMEKSSQKVQEKSQADFIVDSSKKRLLEEYEMTVEAASQKYELQIDEQKAREIVKELRQAIKEIGHVNLDSIESYEEVETRHQKLKSSEEELIAAKETIIDAINQMDQIIVSRLDKTVKGVNEEFNNVFTTMFGGGNAQIKYTLPNNLLETGIDVIAQPPGKTVKNLKLFSGGEKALIAISLLFAILKSKPLPLCILDEVEAALDDANVVRFANYLQQLKQQTQFIVITHRVGTMARVDHLFGATMQNRGVTSFFTVKLDDAKKLIDNV